MPIHHNGGVRWMFQREFWNLLPLGDPVTHRAQHEVTEAIDFV